MAISSRVNDMGRGPFILSVIAAVLAIGGIIQGVGPATDGEIFGFTRIVLGILGLAGAGMLMFGKDFGRTGLLLLIAWAALQSVYYADVPDGNFTRQLFDALAGVSSSTTVNGEVTQYSAVGVNLVGLAMLLFAYTSRNRLDLWRRRAS